MWNLADGWEVFHSDNYNRALVLLWIVFLVCERRVTDSDLWNFMKGKLGEGGAIENQFALRIPNCCPTRNVLLTIQSGLCRALQ
jgi:hypothetical protein